MTGRAAKSQNASRRSQKLREHGEQKICEDKWLTPALQGQFVKVNWFDSPVADAERKKQSLITRITANLLKSFGFASPATSNGTKN